MPPRRAEQVARHAIQAQPVVGAPHILKRFKAVAEQVVGDGNVATEQDLGLLLDVDVVDRVAEHQRSQADRVALAAAREDDQQDREGK